jgi:hypothetical protein
MDHACVALLTCEYFMAGITASRYLRRKVAGIPYNSL